MDTDSLYFALSANKLEEVVKSELQTEFENSKKDWLTFRKTHVQQAASPEHIGMYVCMYVCI